MSRSSIRPLYWYIATWFGCGLYPISGTVGSIGALPFAYAIERLGGNVVLFAASMLMFFIGWWAANEYLKHNNDGEDPKQVVVDEVAGQWLLLSVFPFSWQSYLTGLILFRVFDIIKPWPVSWADRTIKGGLGIMFDDMLAALYPIVIFYILTESQLVGAHKLLVPVMNFLGGVPHVH